jgi:ketosteroid isomerase-like protein
MRSLLFVLAVGCGAASPASQPTPASRPAADVRGAIEQWRQSYEVRSLEGLVDLYSHREDLMIVRETRRVRGWPTFYPELKDFLTKHDKIRMRLADLQVGELGDGAAFASGTALRTYAEGAITREEQGSITLVLRKEDGRWKIVLEHWSLGQAR